jgi:DNA-binding transcriptional LysR family regulator
MDLLLLRSLIHVADLGTIGEAAVALGVSQPALSRRLRVLEEEFGTSLLKRSGRGVVLTEMGRLVVREGRTILDRCDALKENVARHLRLDAGVVRIGGGATVVSHVLPPAIARFRRSHPMVRFDVREAGSREVETMVYNETLDFGVVTLPTNQSDLIVEPLLTDRIVLISGRGHPFVKRKRIPAQELEGQSLVGFEAGSAIRQLIDAALRAANVSVNVVMELRSISAIRRMVETTDSLAFVSEMGAKGAPVLTVSGFRVERQLALICKPQRPLSPAALAFWDRLLASAPL